MNCAALQSRGKTFNVEVISTDYDIAHGVIVRHHADDDIAVEQVGDFGRGLKTKRGELVHLVRASDIGSHPMSGGGEVCGHRCSHATKTDEAAFAYRLSVVCGRGHGHVGAGELIDGFVLQHYRLLTMR
jgi:hypothetical protein